MVMGTLDEFPMSHNKSSVTASYNNAAVDCDDRNIHVYKDRGALFICRADEQQSRQAVEEKMPLIVHQRAVW